MKLKSILKNTIAIGAIASLAVNCQPDKIEQDALLAALAFSTVSNLGRGNCAISVNATAISYGTVEQTVINGNGAGLGISYTALIAHYNSVNGTNVSAGATYIAEPYNKKYDTFYTDAGSWNSTTRATIINSAYVNAAFNTVKATQGTAILACGRIPRSSCSVAALSTADRATDINNAVNVANLLLNTPACRKSTALVENQLMNAALRGISSPVALQNGTFTPNANTFGSNQSFSAVDANGFSGSGGAAGYIHLEGNSVLGERAYPKVGALVSLGFGNIMPARTGATPWAVSATEYTRGANISATNVDSCESIGLPGNGFVATGTNALTPVKEVIYALSSQNTAASIYANVVNATALTSDLGAAGNRPVSGLGKPTLTQAVQDAYACNSAMRARVAIPVAVGGGKLDEINAVSGDGFNTRLLTTCIYGGNATSRGTLATILGAADDTGLNGTLNGIAACPAEAAAAAAKFGDTGLTNLANFPND
ncbi:MAG: hypothetical protein MH321_14595 [Leptospiraceae bacterium]|nr:hypothetical protein [Leptospiraceae bacterium]